MTPEVFVREFEELKEYIGEGHFSEASDISRITRLQIAGFSPSQIELTKELYLKPSLSLWNNQSFQTLPCLKNFYLPLKTHLQVDWV